MDLKGKTVVITGASSGIGKATAKAFASQGARVAVCSSDNDKLQKAAAEIFTGADDFLAVKCDLRNPAEIKRFAEKVIEKYSRVDILINNAAIGVFKKISETTLEEWNGTFSVNLTAPFLVTKEFLPFISGGIIINVSSVAGKTGFPYMSAYSASKFGLVGFTEAAARELPDIKFYAVCPKAVYMDDKVNQSERILETKLEDVIKLILDICKEEKHSSGASVIC